MGWSGRGEGKLVRMDWYPQDYLSDAKTQALSLEEHGAYMLLLWHEWLDGPLPGEPERLRRLLRASVEEWGRIWPAVDGLFQRDGKGRLVSPRLERERKVALEIIQERREAGAKGGKAAAASRRPSSTSEQEPQQTLGFAGASAPVLLKPATAAAAAPKAADAALSSYRAQQATGSSAGSAPGGPPAGALPSPPSGGTFFNGTAADFLEPPRAKPPSPRSGPSDVDPETLVDRRTEAEKAAGRESLRALAARFPKGQRPPRAAPRPKEPQPKAHSLPPEELERRRLEGLRALEAQANTETPPDSGVAGSPGSQEGPDHGDSR